MESFKKQQKTDIVNSLSSKLASVESALIVNYQGLSSQNLNTLRETLSRSNSKLQAVKKSLLRIALKRAGKKNLARGELTGQTAVVLIKENPLITIRALNDFAKKFTGPQFVTGSFEGTALEEQDFVKLSRSPPKEVLLTQLAAIIKNPITRLTLLTTVNQRRLVFTLNASRR